MEKTGNRFRENRMSQDKYSTEMTELLPEEPEEELRPLPGQQMEEKNKNHARSGIVEGRNAVQEALRAGKTADRLYIQDGLRDPAIGQIVSKVKKQEFYFMSIKNGWKSMTLSASSYDSIL